MASYEPKKIEEKWQKKWEEDGIYAAHDFSEKPKYYALVEFPYPSGDGLHTGHVRSYAAMDLIARKRRMEGYNVLYPIGWDAFGLPTENYAIKTGIHPKVVTKNNTDTFRRQMKSLGFSFDWSREINTTDPAYYRWTQWIFLQLFKKGLAYKERMPINWCPSCKIGLANEEVIGGKCERCGTPVERHEKEQWMLAITKYADRLLADLKTVDYLEKIKTQQINWIGKSEGAEIDFSIAGTDRKLTVFTTRPDTLFGATYAVIAPEHELIAALGDRITNRTEIEEYTKKSAGKSEEERIAEGREKTGVEIKGVKAVNPANGAEIPVFVADYVLSTYGTGAIMAVPAHDERDFEFAKKFGLPIKQVVLKPNAPIKSYLMGGGKITDQDMNNLGIKIAEVAADGDRKIIIPESKLADYEKLISEKLDENFWNEYVGKETVFIFKHNGGEIERIVLSDATSERIDKLAMQFTGESFSESPWLMLAKNKWYADVIIHPEYGQLINSGRFSGMDSGKAKVEIVKFVGGRPKAQFHLRDWVFSRQHYWGEPIPIIFCEKDGMVPVPENELPVLLPEIEKYQPTDNGESPLAAVSEWVNTKCPKCGGPARRETDTMPNWAGSSWYFLRYIDPKNDTAPADPKKLAYWMPVDWYNGGMEHTTLHLLYSRFWNKFLNDIGVAPTSEPYQKRTSQGMVLGKGGEKMSKSKGNVVNPDFIVANFGADILRVYEMFMGPFDQAIPWDERGILGSERFLVRLWKYCEARIAEGDKGEKECTSRNVLLHRTIKKVGEDIEAMKFNTAISALMILLNELETSASLGREELASLVKIIHPIVPHMAQELWSLMGNASYVDFEPWPAYDSALIAQEKITIVFQVNGKTKDTASVDATIAEAAAKEMALASEKVKAAIAAASGDAQGIATPAPKRIIYVDKKLVNIVI
jgi:leucyl-tRNA synthetase